MPDIGKLKVEAAKATLQRFNPHVRIDTVAERLTPQNAAQLVAAADIVVDAADSFAVTYMLERRLPGRRQAAGQCLGDRHDRLCRRLLRRRCQLSRRVSRSVGRWRHLPRWA